MSFEMKRIDKILNHDLFIANLKANEDAERERVFCHHDMVHFLDVARIGRIINVEEQMGVEVELLYAAALLHDLGKHLQYSEGIPHEQSGAEIAPFILRDCGFDEKETTVIVDAIASHRDSSVKDERNLRGLLYRADKASRACYACKVCGECNWKDGKKNQEILY